MLAVLAAALLGTAHALYVRGRREARPVALAFAWRHRDLVRGSPRGPWALAVVLAGAAAIHDLLPLHLTALEESAELGAALALLVAVGASLRRLLARP